MDLKALENFLKIAELGSMSSAADKLRIPQPALSRQLRALEHELKAALFIRHRRGMQLTSAGEELKLKLTGPLRQIELAMREVRSLSSDAGGTVALGMPPTVSYLLAGRLAKRVAEQAPNISLRIVEGYSGHLVDWLHRGDIDAGILYGPASDLQMRSEELLLDQLMLVGPPSSRLRPDVPVPVRDLAHYPLVLPSFPHGMRVVVEHAARRVKISLNVRHQADSFLVLKELAQYGLGYAILPLSSFTRRADDGRLRYAPLIDPPVMRQLVLGAHNLEVSRAKMTIRNLIKLEIKELVANGSWVAQLQF